MRKLPSYLEFKLQELVIFGVTFLLAFGAIRFASFVHFSPKISDEIPLIALFTCPLFGFFIAESRGWRTQWSFWIFTAALLVTHLLVFLTLIMRPISIVHSTGRWVFLPDFSSN